MVRGTAGFLFLFWLVVAPALGAAPPHKQAAPPLKKVLDRQSIVEMPGALARTLSVSEFVGQRLGKRFHRRGQWAGSGHDFAPRLTNWRVWEPIGKVHYLTIHHAAGVPNEHPARMIRNIFTGHTHQGGRLDAADVGYHFFVDRNGHVWEGRDAARMGTHVGSIPSGLNNLGNLGICGLGEFTHSAPSKAMVQAVVELAELLAEYYNQPLRVRGHNDWIGVNQFDPGGLACPARLDVAVRQANSRIAARFPAAKIELAAHEAAEN